MRLSTFAAIPRVVTLAGIPMLVSKISLYDLAVIEDWMTSAIPRPGPGEEDIPGGWPPAFDTPAGLALIGTGEGVARLVFAALRRSTEGLTVDHARAIAGGITPEEFPAFYSAIFPAPDESAIADRPGPRRANWHARINEMAATYGYTPAQILELPLDQFFALGRDAAPEKAAPRWAVPIKGPADLDRLWAERQARMGGGADGTAGLN